MGGRELESKNLLTTWRVTVFGGARSGTRGPDPGPPLSHNPPLSGEVVDSGKERAQNCSRTRARRRETGDSVQFAKRRARTAGTCQGEGHDMTGTTRHSQQHSQHESARVPPMLPMCRVAKKGVVRLGPPRSSIQSSIEPRQLPQHPKGVQTQFHFVLLGGLRLGLRPSPHASNSSFASASAAPLGLMTPMGRYSPFHTSLIRVA